MASVNIDDMAAIIRKVDGDNKLGADALAEAIVREMEAQRKPLVYDLKAMEYEPHEHGLWRKFVWRKTPEGDIYWSDIFHDIATPETMAEAQYKLADMQAQYEKENS